LRKSDRSPHEHFDYIDNANGSSTKAYKSQDYRNMHENLCELTGESKDSTNENQYSQERRNECKDADHSGSEVAYKPKNYQK